MSRLIQLIGVLLCIVGLGCAKHEAYPSAGAVYDESYAPAPSMAPAADLSGDFMAKAPSGRSYQAAESRAAGAVAPSEPSPRPAPSDPAPKPTPAARMVHYEGYAKLRVSQLDDAVDQATALATSLGGKVESSTRARVVLRVPVAAFQAAFPKFLGLGDVLQKSITAQDVTDAFLALELRMQTAEASRDRLVALLAKSTDEQEKLMLLREIQRLEEEIDRLHAQTATLSDLATMSRITLDLVPRDAVVARSSGQESLALGWLRGLSPFRDDAWQSGRRLTGLDAPEGLVQLDPKRYTAEAADGARIRGCRLVNEPIGSGDWWVQAVQERLAPDFAKADVRRVGDWTLVRFLDRSDAPYVYVVGARADGNWLDFVEVYYPSVATEERHTAAVDAALGGGAS